jgi:beta-lactamase regulating signal transducer with metallopeptidase domain
MIAALASNWAIHLAHALWQSTLAAALVLALAALLRNQSPRLRHALVMIGIVKFALPPMLPMPTGIFSATPPVPELIGIRNAVGGADIRIIVVLMAAHLAGALIAVFRLGIDIARLRRLRKGAEPFATERGVPILVSRDIVTPVTTGVLGPAILLPAALARSLSPAALRDVIAHEMQHVRRRDVLLNCLQALLGALWWFHPLYRLLDRRARELREESCDDALIAGGEIDRAHYARTLLTAAAFVAERTPLSAAGIAETRHSLLVRIRRLGDLLFTRRRHGERPRKSEIQQWPLVRRHNVRCEHDVLRRQRLSRNV